MELVGGLGVGADSSRNAVVLRDVCSDGRGYGGWNCLYFSASVFSSNVCQQR